MDCFLTFLLDREITFPQIGRHSHFHEEKTAENILLTIDSQKAYIRCV